MSPMIKLPLTTEHALLGFLWQRSRYGYEIHQTLQQHDHPLGMVWHLKQSQLYALLGKLEEAGYLTGSTEQQGSRPPRRLLQLTASGRAAFREWLSTPVARAREMRLEFLAKLYFAQETDQALVSTLISDQRHVCTGWLADLRQQAAALGDAQPYTWLVFQFRISQVEAILHWLDSCAARLGAPQAQDLSDATGQEP